MKRLLSAWLRHAWANWHKPIRYTRHVWVPDDSAYTVDSRGGWAVPVLRAVAITACRRHTRAARPALTR